MNTPTRSLIGTVWTHKRKGGRFRITDIMDDPQRVYLQATPNSKARCKGEWRWLSTLEFDYEEVVA